VNDDIDDVTDNSLLTLRARRWNEGGAPAGDVTDDPTLLVETAPIIVKRRRKRSSLGSASNLDVEVH
jgi:hypothetical protein